MSQQPRLEIHTVDVHDDDDLRAWHDVYLRAETFERAAASPWQYDEIAALARSESAQMRRASFLGRVEGRPVAAAAIAQDTSANQHIVLMLVHVLPDQRRLGYGSALLAHAEAASREWGCTSAIAEASWDPDMGESGTGSAGREFAVRHGYGLGLSSLQRRLQLPADEATLARMAAEAESAYAGGYELESWTGAVPDTLAEGVARLQAKVGTEAPMGDLEFEEESPDVALMREREELQVQQGRTKYGFAAVSLRSGEVVAYTDLVTTVHEPGVAYQWGTLVDRSHRGHRLGLAVKVANVQRLMSERPDVTRLVTYNAVSNRHMVEINDRLGFEPVEYLGEFQKHLADER